MNAAIPNSSYNYQVSNAGFTLIELMVTIAVLAIIVSIAAPNISTQLANQRVKSTASTLSNALKEAKAESLIRRQDISVIYNSATKTVTLQNPSSTALATYTLNSNSTVDITPASATTLTFQPNKATSNGIKVTYSVCDSNIVANPRQIEVSLIGNISSDLGGTC